MIKRILIHNFRSLVNFEWHPPQACVLVGENGSGKSALLEALWVLRGVVVDGMRYEETGFPSTLTAWTSGGEQVIEIDLELDGKTLSYRLGCESPNRKLTINETLRGSPSFEYSARDGEVVLITPGGAKKFPFDRRRSFLPLLEDRANARDLLLFRDAVASWWAIRPDVQKLGAGSAKELGWLNPSLANFADWYRASAASNPAALALLQHDLRRAIVGFDQLQLEAVGPDLKDLVSAFDFGGVKHKLGWGKLSDGQRLLIALYGAFRLGFEHHATLVMLDEIENYVSPSEIQPWLRAVADSLAEDKRQLIVVSHHPEAINYMAADAVWRMWRDPASGCSKIEKLEPDRDVGETAYDLVKMGHPVEQPDGE